MKKIYFLFLFALTLSYAAIGQEGLEAPQNQSVVITKIGATWCPNCGTAAWDNFATLYEKYANDAVLISVHPSRSSSLHAPEAIEFTENLPQAWGQPLFYVNRDKYSTNQILSNAETSINSARQTIPLANTGVVATFKGSKLEVNAKVKFFKEGNGDYHLALLIIEDGVIADQASRGSNAVHEKILRGSFTNNAFGQSFANGKVAANTTFDFSLSMDLPASWNTENIEVVAIIYQKDGDAYQFVNAHSVDAQFSTAINILENLGVTLSLSPTIVEQSANIAIDLPETLKNVDLSVYNTAGQQVISIFSGDLSAGTTNFSIEKSAFSTSGIYFLKMEKDGSAISKKFIIE